MKHYYDRVYPHYYFLLLMLLCLSCTEKPNPETTYLTKDGAWCWFSDPRTIQNEGHTYVGWVSSQGAVVLAHLDHENGMLDTVELAQLGEIDDHDNPALLLDEQQKLNIIFSKHSSPEPMQWWQTNPGGKLESVYLVDALMLNDTGRYSGLSNTYTYSYLASLSQEDNRKYLCWRGSDFKPNISWTNDQGEWGKGQILILPARTYRNRRPYLKMSSNGKDRIHFAFTDGHPRNESTNSIYYFQYAHDSLRLASELAIKPLSNLPIAPQESEVVYDAKSTNERAWVWDVAENRVGQPRIVYTRFPDASTHDYYYAWFDGENWHNEFIVHSGAWFPTTPAGETEPEPHYSGGLVLDHDDPSIVYASVKIDTHFEILRYKFDFTRRNWEVTPVTENSKRDNIRPVVVRQHTLSNGPQVMWLEVDQYQHYTDFKTAIRMQ